MSRNLGRLLRGVHAGETHLAWNQAATTRAPVSILTTDAFPAGGIIPVRYAGRGVGDNISPALRWSNPPAGTAEWALIMQDPDAPLPRPFVHLIAYDIPAKVTELQEGALSTSSSRVAKVPIRASTAAHSAGAYRSVWTTTYFTPSKLSASRLTSSGKSLS